jgi:hypothetical protein
VNGFEIELMLAGWRETHNGGFTVTFIVSPEDAEHLKSDTAAKGKMAGQIYMAVFVRVDEAPAPKQVIVDAGNAAVDRTSKSHFPGGLCGLAVRWCDDAHFQEWIYTKFPGLTTAAPVSVAEGSSMAKYVICAMCKIESRKQLDTAIGADRIFRANFLEPYAAQRKADGIDEE